MTTLQFPVGIDSFDAHAPGEIIRAVHVNNLQDAVTAVEVFVFSLEQTLNSHLGATINVHPASAISLAAILNPPSGWSANNLQDAIQQLKNYIDSVVALDATTVELQAHQNTPISSAHPGQITSSQIPAAAVTQAQLNFPVATYGVTSTNQDLAYHESLGINIAHAGPLLGSNIAVGTVTLDRLAFTPALASELLAHINTGGVPSAGSGAPSGTPAFGTARTYAILGASAVTGSTGAGSTLTGNLGIYPGTSITNFPPSTYTGTQDVANGAANTAHASALASYTDLSTRPAGTLTSTLDSLTLTPGTYTSGSSMSLAASGAGTLTLNGAGVYIFQIGSTLTTGSGGTPTIVLTGGALASNIYWVVGSSATLNSGFSGTFHGNVIAQASITVTSGGTVNGTLTTITGAVTLSATTAVNVQALAVSPGYAHVAAGIQLTPTVDGYADVQSAMSGLYNINTNHITATSGVHGVTGNVVGTTDTQFLQNKTIISAFTGTKIALFSGTVEEIEKKLFVPGYGPLPSPSATDSQFIIRKPATSLVTAQVISSVTVPVFNPLLFSPGNSVSFYQAPGYGGAPLTGTVATVGGSFITLTSPISLPNNSAAVNTSIINPLFEVDPDGYGVLQNLQIKNSTLYDIKFDDNLIVNHNLTVLGNTILGSNGADTVVITGPLNIAGLITATGAMNLTGALTAGSVSSGNITGSGTLQITGASTLTGAVTAGSTHVVGDLVVDGYGTFGGTVTANQFSATTGLYNGINLPGLYADFNAHLSDAYGAHASTAISYSSLQYIDTSVVPSTNALGLTEQATIQVNPNPIDGYVQVDRTNLFHIADNVIIGDSFYGFGAAIVTDIRAAATAPITPFDKIYLNTIPGGLTTTQNARVIKEVDNVRDAIDALTIDMYDHIHDLVRTHKAISLTTDPFSFSSTFYTPFINGLGDITVQAVLNEFGTDLYHHLDGYDGYTYPHPAQDISFSNTLVNMGRRISLTTNALVTTSTLNVVDASQIFAGDVIELHSDTQPSESHVVATSNGISVVTLTTPLGYSYLVADNAYLLDFTLKTVQDALEALSSNYDLTNHITDPIDAHDASAISFSDAYNGFFATDVQSAIVALAGANWNQATDPTFKTHLEHSRIFDGYTAHDGYAINYDNSTTGLAANEVQTAIDQLKALVDADFASQTAALTAHITDPIGAHAATAISMAPFNNAIASTVQASLQEWNRPGDLVDTTFAMANNQVTPANVTGLMFNPAVVRSAVVEYSIYRYYTAPPSTTEIATVGTLRLVYKTIANIWILEDTYAGDSSGITFTMLPSGQVQYTSTNILGTFHSNVLHFRARVTGV